jgi:effector-binding domain-containing protein
MSRPRLIFPAALAALLLLASPLAAQTPAPQGHPAQSGDPFGEEVMLTPKTFLYMKGNATWDTAYDTLIDAFKTVNDFLQKQGLKAAGQQMTVYTATDDTGFTFQAGVPLETEPATKPTGDLEIGKSPEGKALKFVHRGTYDGMDSTYEAITNHLDEKGLEAKDYFVEQYVTDPVSTAEDKLVIEVYVPLK